MLHYVYELRDSIQNRVFYVGLTNNPKRRLREHRSLLCISTAPFIKQLIVRGIRVDMVIIAKCDTREEAEVREAYFIKKNNFCKIATCNGGKQSKKYPRSVHSLSNAQRHRTSQKV